MLRITVTVSVSNNDKIISLLSTLAQKQANVTKISKFQANLNYFVYLQFLSPTHAQTVNLKIWSGYNTLFPP